MENKKIENAGKAKSRKGRRTEVYRARRGMIPEPVRSRFIEPAGGAGRMNPTPTEIGSVRAGAVTAQILMICLNLRPKKLAPKVR